MQNLNSNKTSLIIGANSEIAKALAKQIMSENGQRLIVVSRNIAFYQQAEFKHCTVIQVANYQADEIENAARLISKGEHNDISQVFICHGVLHSNHFQPEKRLEDFTAEAFSDIVSANTITPMLWLKALVPYLAKIKIDCKVVIFNARVGSISDNKLGGWYSYRASKAALNMLIKSTGVELKRRAKNIKLISFHPGTTDSPLSKPFQKNVPEGKLFTSDYVAKKLLTIVQNTSVDGEASYLDWQGKTITW